MKEATESIDIAALKGLRRFKTNPKNKHALVELFNLAPCDEGVKPHEAVTSMNASGVSWGGLGDKDTTLDTTSITINIKDYVDDADIAGASVYLDGVLKGTTDSEGEIDIANVEIGVHNVKITKSGYTDSDQDDLLNDLIVVT